MLGYGGFLLLGGRSADLLGRRRVLLGGLAVFTAASAVGGVVDDGTLLVVTRFLKGASAAFTAPAGLSIITTRFAEGPERNRALSIYTATGASGFSMGLVAGGPLTELGWRWTFLLPVPIALVLLALAPRFLPRDRAVDAPSRRAFDIPGAVTLTAGMLLLVRTIVEAPEQGWGAPETIGAFVLAALLLVAFVAIEQRAATPLVRLGILRSGPLVRANLGMGALFGAYVGFQFVDDALPADDERLVAHRDRARVPARRAPRGRGLPAHRSARGPLRRGPADRAGRRLARRSATRWRCASTRIPPTRACCCLRSCSSASASCCSSRR